MAADGPVLRSAAGKDFGFEEVGGLYKVAEKVGWTILVEGFDHPAQARFFKAFWEWAKASAAARK